MTEDEMMQDSSGYDEDEDEELSAEDVAQQAEDKVDALIELLISKGQISREELDQVYNELLESDEEDEGNDDDSEESEPQAQQPEQSEPHFPA